MITDKFWGFMKDNVLSLITVLVGLVVLILQSLGLASPQMVTNTTLALVALLATSEIVERQQQLSKLEKTLSDEKEVIALGLDKLLVKEISSHDSYEYMRYLFLTSRKSILWASAERRRGTSSDTRRVYEDAVDSIVKKGDVRFTWITYFDGKARAERAHRFIFQIKPKANVYIGRLPEQPNDFPLLSFVIFDETTLITRAPFAQGGRGNYFVITSPSVISLFLNYFDRLLALSQKLEPTEETRHFLNSLVH